MRLCRGTTTEQFCGARTIKRRGALNTFDLHNYSLSPLLKKVKNNPASPLPYCFIKQILSESFYLHKVPHKCQTCKKQARRGSHKTCPTPDGKQREANMLDFRSRLCILQGDFGVGGRMMGGCKEAQIWKWACCTARRTTPQLVHAA